MSSYYYFNVFYLQELKWPSPIPEVLYTSLVNAFSYAYILSICPSVMGGQRKRFDLETKEAVSLATERWKLELSDLCERQSWHYVATGVNTSFLDRLYVNKVTLDPYMLWPAAS